MRGSWGWGGERGGLFCGLPDVAQCKERRGETRGVSEGDVAETRWSCCNAVDARRHLEHVNSLDTRKEETPYQTDQHVQVGGLGKWRWGGGGGFISGRGEGRGGGYGELDDGNLV